MSAIIDFPHHDISLIVDGKQITGWETYEISTSMLEPADHFTVRMPFSRDAWDLCRTDRPVRVMIDDTSILKGLIDERMVPEDDEAVEILGRDLVGRIVDESAPSLNFEGLDMFELVKRVAAPWFTKVTFTNARNRKVIRGKGKKSRAGGEPVKLNTKKSIGTRVEPGQTRWQVIEDLCAQAGYLCWAAADGSELIVGEPNYEQEVQFKFFLPAKNSPRSSESTVLGMGVRESTAQRYSRIVCVGSGIGTDANYGASVDARYGEAKDNQLTPEGDGNDFSAPKRLIIPRAVSSIAEAKELAEREMARRDSHGDMITVRAPGHGQVIAGAYTTIFAPDTLAFVEDERTGTKGTYLITECVYRSHRQGGEETTMVLVPSGAELIS